jgi:ketosteroid isomerase-like protein
MSQENVQLVLRLTPRADVEIVELLGDDDKWAALAEAIAPFFHGDCETVAPGVPGTETTYTGLDGLRAAWLDWLAPWTTYRSEIAEVIDCGERVLLIVNDFGRREGSTQEVKIDGAAVWTFRDGKVARVEAFADRSEALKAARTEE